MEEKWTLIISNRKRQLAFLEQIMRKKGLEKLILVAHNLKTLGTEENRTGIRRDINNKKILKATKDKKLWRAMIDLGLKGHDK